MNFHQRLEQACQLNQSHLCIGIDPIVDAMPKHIQTMANPFINYCQWLVDQTAPFASAFKFQVAHFSATANELALEQAINYLQQHYPKHLIILDAKRSDIGSTADFYHRESFSRYGVDAVTLNPYVGSEGLKPFLADQTKGAIVICRTSNGRKDDVQSLLLADQTTPVYLHIAQQINAEQQNNGMLVVGATQIDAIKTIRRHCPEIPFLIPGVGKQGGDLTSAVINAKTKTNSGFLVSVSRAISQHEKPAEAARLYRDEINSARIRAPA